MSESDDTQDGGGNSPIKLIILVVVILGLVGALFYSKQKTASLTPEVLVADPNAPKAESKMPDFSKNPNIMKQMMGARKAALDSAKKDETGAADAPTTPTEAAPAPSN